MNFGKDFVTLLESGLKEYYDGIDNFPDGVTNIVIGHQTPVIGEKIYTINNNEYVMVRDWVLPVYNIESKRIGNCAKTRFRKLKKEDGIDIFDITGNEKPSNPVVKYVKEKLLKNNFLDNYRKTHPEKEACFLAVKPSFPVKLFSNLKQSGRHIKYCMIPFGEHEMVLEESLWNIKGYTGVSYVPRLKIQSNELPKYPRLELKSKTCYLW